MAESRLQKLMLRKLELWAVGLLLVLCAVGTIGFGTIVLDEAERQNGPWGGRFGALGHVAIRLAQAPLTAVDLLKGVGTPETRMMALVPPEDLDGGWTWAGSPEQAEMTGYLLLSRHDGNAHRHVIELTALPEGQVVHSWAPDAEALLKGITRKPEWDSLTDYQHWDNRTYRWIHPYLGRDGRLLGRDHGSPLFMFSPCGTIDWVEADLLYHHSIEPDGAGGFWVPAWDGQQEEAGRLHSFKNDMIVRLTADGEVDFELPLTDLLLEAGFRHLIFPPSRYHFDPLHLNDIQPVPGDGPFWKKGDLFLSFREPSLVLLLRPDTREIVWSQAGPWNAQHDIDILDDHRIALFDNAAYDAGWGVRVAGISQPVIFDFRAGTVETPYDDTLQELGSMTTTEGLQNFTETGQVIIEVENQGRIILLGQEGDLIGQYLNRAENGEVYRMGWSRYLTQADGNAALAAIKAASCP